MTDRVPKLLVEALGAIASARELVAGRSLADYAADKLRRSAFECQFEILGEACARIARLVLALLASVVNLKLAIGMRNLIIHGYDAADDEIVYITVMDDPDALKADLLRLLAARGRAT